MMKPADLNGRILEVPIIQGGMGVGVSLSSLAGHVMKEGGMGVISAAHPGYARQDFRQDSIHANGEALKEACAKARAISGGRGLLGVNIMVASTDYDTYVKASVEAGADAIISGAGLPLHLPSLVEGSDILLAPIISSAKAAKLVLRYWDSHYGRTPDFIVIEGSEAGGHLGFCKEDLEAGTCQPLEEILTEVKQVCVPFETKYGRKIPLFPAGGIYDGADIARMMKLGAAGVQMATRFIATDECDASDAFKQAVINCRKEDITLVKSPAGLPGRALNNRFAQKVQGQMISMSNCLHCMKPCDPKHTPYCISEALIRAVSKDAEDGIVFIGANAWRVDRMMHVSELMKELITGTEEALKEN